MVAFALRSYHLGTPSLWYDELLELDIAQGPFSHIFPELPRHAAMPLDYVLLHSWVKLGRQESWVRWPALFFGTLAVPLMYRLASSLFNRSVGCLAGLLLSFNSFAIDYSQEVRPYALLLCLVMLSYWGVWQAYRTGRDRYWLLAAIGFVGATLSHYFALFAWLPVMVFVGWQQLSHWRTKRVWQHSLYFGFCLFLISLLLLIFGRPYTLYSVGLRFTTAFAEPATLTLPATEKPNRGAGPALSREFIIHKIVTPLTTSNPIVLLGYNFFLLIAILTLLKPLHRPAILYLLGWLIVPTMLIYLFLLHRGTFFAARYILYTLPAYLILVAYGLIQLTYYLEKVIGSQPLARLLTSLMVVGLLSGELADLVVYYGADSPEDWRAVGQLLRDNAQPTDAVIAINAEPAINWYYPPATRPFKHYYRRGVIQQTLRQHDRRWFILSSYSYNRDQSVREWLKQQGAVLIAFDRRVVVYFHHRGRSPGELLAEVETFVLPPKAYTYEILARQFAAQGSRQASEAFYSQARQLAK